PGNLMSEQATRRSDQPRRPSIAGVGGGVGTTTVAVALSGSDCGVFTGRAVDVLVCRSTADSVIRAGRAAQLVNGVGFRPVLAVTAVDGTRPTRALLARLRLLEPHAAAVVLLPHVGLWRASAAPLDGLRQILGRSIDEMPRPARGYARAIGELKAALGAGPRAPATAVGHTAARHTPFSRRESSS
ncbi:hypothetical protein, partial [Pseudonocardia oceani]